MAIPALSCLTYDEAKFLLSSSGLVVGQVFKDASVTDAGSAFIWRQSPAPAEDITATAGQAIDLYLTQSLPQNCQ